ncbi:hypothetical protein KY289_022126 [Solanum tuberosum]|nr:hypothetical protein KY289_022126 [Solanum tuberosum]
MEEGHNENAAFGVEDLMHNNLAMKNRHADRLMAEMFAGKSILPDRAKTDIFFPLKGEFDSVLLLLNYGAAFICMGIQSVVNEKAGRSAGLHNDIVGVVLRCGPSKYAGRTQNRCREVTISDDQ